MKRREFLAASAAALTTPVPAVRRAVVAWVPVPESQQERRNKAAAWIAKEFNIPVRLMPVPQGLT